MAAKIYKTIKLFLTFLKIYARSFSQYRAEFLGGGLFVILTNSIFMFALIYLAKKYGSFGGLTADEFVAAIAIGVYGFFIGGNFFSGNRKLADKIYKGNLDTMLLRPLPLFIQTQLIAVNRSAIGELIFAIFFGFFVNPAYWPRIIVFAISGGIIINLWVYCLNLLTIHTDINHSRGGFDAFVNFHFYPTNMFDPITKFIAMFIIPGGLMSFAPMYMIYEPNLVWVYWIFVITLIIGTRYFEQYSLKKYTGAS